MVEDSKGDEELDDDVISSVPKVEEVATSSSSSTKIKQGTASKKSLSKEFPPREKKSVCKDYSKEE